MIVGIDNGLDGGLCAISSRDARIIDKIPMPTFQNSKKPYQTALFNDLAEHLRLRIVNNFFAYLSGKLLRLADTRLQSFKLISSCLGPLELIWALPIPASQ